MTRGLIFFRRRPEPPGGPGPAARVLDGVMKPTTSGAGSVSQGGGDRQHQQQEAMANLLGKR